MARRGRAGRGRPPELATATASHVGRRCRPMRGPYHRDGEGLGREGGLRLPAMVLRGGSLPPVGGDDSEAMGLHFAK